ncbi:MAG TPA: hypothetical protein VK448_07325 [Dissulfurispiraceae bacterium]|nr:hypothetical protein [Dissulfurispiraceae bacterium]
MSNKKIAVLILCLFFLAIVGTVCADDKNSVPVYPGAKPDAETAKFLKDGLKLDGAAYLTNDSIAKVIAYYKGQKDLKVLFEDKEGAKFENSKKLSVTIQNPWRDMKTGKMRSDTLISIVNEKKR